MAGRSCWPLPMCLIFAAYVVHACPFHLFGVTPCVLHATRLDGPCCLHAPAMCTPCVPIMFKHCINNALPICACYGMLIPYPIACSQPHSSCLQLACCMGCPTRPGCLHRHCCIASCLSPRLSLSFSFVPSFGVSPRCAPRTVHPMAQPPAWHCLVRHPERQPKENRSDAVCHVTHPSSWLVAAAARRLPLQCRNGKRHLMCKLFRECCLPRGNSRVHGHGLQEPCQVEEVSGEM